MVCSRLGPLAGWEVGAPEASLTTDTFEPTLNYLSLQNASRILGWNECSMGPKDQEIR